MHRNEASIEIAAPPEHVFPHIVSPEQRVLWVAGLASSEETADGAYREVVDDHGLRLELAVETVRSDPPGALDARMTGRGLRASVTNRLEATQVGTRLTVVVESEYGGLARFVAPVVTRHAQGNLERSLSRLKALVEDGDAGGP